MHILHFIKRVLFGTIYIALIVCGLYACASIGNPGGGDYDVAPPAFLRSNPEPNKINFDGNKITIWFDEFINISNPNEKVIITPPQLKMPIIKSVGKRITVELRDSLIPNTTYTFDFTDAIIDNNEGNALENFSFAFSTGEIIDSLEVSGLLLNSSNLEPMSKIIVGIHSDLSDSAFINKPFVRTSQTDDRGRFTIKNIAPGTYRLYALKDVNRDFKFDQLGEAIAFYDSLIVPSFTPAVRKDTIWHDTITIDTIIDVPYTRFTPDDIIIRLFEHDNEQQYLSRSSRVDSNKFTMEFNSDIKMPPSITLLDEREIEDNINDWFILQQSPDCKTMTYWITDSMVWQRDTLLLKAEYVQHDTLNNLVSKIDTLRLYQRRKAKQSDNDEITFLDVNVSPAGSINVFDTVKVIFSEPVNSSVIEKINIVQKIDTLWHKVDMPLIQDTLNPLAFYFLPNWPYKHEYQIQIDSAAITSVYGKWNDAKKSIIKTKAVEDYGALFVQITGISNSGFGQLLNSREQVVKESKVIDGELIFVDIQPGRYFLRYILDSNQNMKWDTGNYKDNIQPEEVFYYPTFFDIKKYMEWEQSWNVTALPLERQKPIEITKNKPKEKKAKRDRNEERKNKNTSSQKSLF
ncbi:uncharacterized protein (DUF2141 family) [Dysgonomonadaceae bacterium PH5-43]|nr:uncharacterized protein (DUF2141 family) [Dysgonomonadaceae bacterium PH5-43]